MSEIVAKNETDNADAAASGTKRDAETADLNSDTSNDKDHEDSKKLQARREANRMHAFKSRQRSKLLLAELQSTVEKLSSDKSELERHNAVLRAQVEVLQQQNYTLMQSHQQMVLQNQQSASGSAAAQPAPAPFIPNPAMGMPPFAAGAAAAAAANPFMASLSQLAAANPSFMMAMMGSAFPQHQALLQQPQAAQNQTLNSSSLATDTASVAPPTTVAPLLGGMLHPGSSADPTPLPTAGNVLQQSAEAGAGGAPQPARE